MAGYVLSNSNRFYVAVENQYGRAATISGENRFPAMRVAAQQSTERGRRNDKTGTRTYRGASPYGRKKTAFEVKGFLSSWNGNGQPPYGPLFQAGLGGSPRLSVGLSVAAVQSVTQFQTTAPHGLTKGMGIAYANEIRFVTQVLDENTFAVNTAFTTTPIVNTLFAPTVSYPLAIALPSLSIFDYWEPGTFLNRVVTGAVVDQLHISVNGDVHELSFRGPASNLVTASGFLAGDGSLSVFPQEPSVGTYDYTIVPGHLGQAWIGTADRELATLTAASLQVRNNVSLRRQEFGSSLPRGITAGVRDVSCDLSLLVQDEAQTEELYASAKRRGSLPIMLQLGQQQGQLLGIFLPKVTPEIPVYNDSEPRLEWQFKNNVAQGETEDEMYVAFA